VKFEQWVEHLIELFRRHFPRWDFRLGLAFHQVLRQSA
jgi:hypothetical protein